MALNLDVSYDTKLHRIMIPLRNGRRSKNHEFRLAPWAKILEELEVNDRETRNRYTALIEISLNIL